MGNFGFLAVEWPDLHHEAEQAERAACSDPRSSCFYARRCLELAVDWLYDADDTLRPPYRDTLAAKVTEPSLQGLTGPAINTKMEVIRRRGNLAVHGTGRVAERDSIAVLRELFHVMYWLARNYSRAAEAAPATGLVFNAGLLPRPVSPEVQQKRIEELQKLEEAHARRDAELARAREEDKDLDTQLTKLRKEIKAAKAHNANRVAPDLNEAQTRTAIIDLLLKEAGWDLTETQDRESPVIGMPNKSGKGKVDYVLWDDNGLPLALVEAKRTSRDSHEGQHQAKLYADCLEQMFGQRPIIFYTNGYETHLWDDVNYPPRPVQGFLTKDQLRLTIQRRVSRQVPAKLTVNPQIVDRVYQLEAISRVGESFAIHQKRDALVVMATGAGKTRTIIGLVDQLSRANWVKRVLFLADRQALVTQAVNAFKTHLPGLPTVNLLEDKKDMSARVFVSTYPTMMGMVEKFDGGRRRFGPGFFDLVVVDEAHRSIYQKYGALFDYFDSLLLGLTATPKDEIDRNTYRRFQLEDGVPTAVYGLNDAISDGYLVPPKTIDVPSKFQRHGIKYDELSEAEKEQWEEAEWDADGNVPDSVNTEELNKYLFNSDTIDKALAALMTSGLKVDGGDTLGKTIIFAKNQEHAKVIAERFNANYPEYRGEFARIITHKVERSDDLIKKFGVANKLPQIAISVDMMDTGIDVPEVVNLVFFKLVRSRTKFWQMIGRGTRLRPGLFGPGKDKDHFRVFDLCQNFEFFNQGLAKAEGTLAKSLSERLFTSRTDLVLALDQQPTGQLDAQNVELRQQVVERLHQEVTGMNPENFLVRPHREQVDTYSRLSSWENLTQHAHDEVTEHLAPLPTAFRESENREEAKRFDLVALKLQLCVLTGEPGFDKLRTKVQEIASALLDQTTIPKVAEQQLLLDELSGDEWWQDVTPPMLETMRKRVRGLVHLIERTKRSIVYSDFEDEFGELTEVELKEVALGTNWTKFQAKARVYLQDYPHHVTLEKLRRNKQITTADIDELERIFLENEIGTPEDMDRAATEAGGFGLFIRSIQGLERDAITEALSRFCAGKTFSANQLNFLKQITDYLSRNGAMKIGRLYEPPFISLAPRGPESIFTKAEVDTLEEILHAMRDTAIPVAAAA